MNAAATTSPYAPVGGEPVARAIVCVSMIFWRATRASRRYAQFMPRDELTRF